MQTRLAKWLFLSISIGVAIYLVIFLIGVNQNDASIYNLDANLPKTKEINPIKVEKNWLESFSHSETQGYFYPVTEISIELNLKNPNKIKNSYILKTGKLDEYQLFCLKQVLKQHRINYKLQEIKGDAEVVIYSTKRPKLNQIVKALKPYKIQSKISQKL